MKNALPFALLFLLGCSEPRPTTKVATFEQLGVKAQAAQQEDAVAPPTYEQASMPTSGITLASYQRLQTGMTYGQATAILGGEGAEMSSNDIGGTRTVMYQWQAGTMANMNAMFQNGKLISKAQFGLN